MYTQIFMLGLNLTNGIGIISFINDHFSAYIVERHPRYFSSNNFFLFISVLILLPVVCSHLLPIYI